MYHKTDRLGGTLRVQRYKKYLIYANKSVFIIQNSIHKMTSKITSYSYAILPHYHTITQNNVSNVCKYAKKILPLRGILRKNNY